MQKGKEGTGRIVMWRLGIRNSYTMESTFGGSTLGKDTCKMKIFCQALKGHVYFLSYSSRIMSDLLQLAFRQLID